MIRRSLAGLTCLLFFGCASTALAPEPRPARHHQPRTDLSAASASAHRAVPLASVQPGTYGPVSIALGQGGLSVWAAPGERLREFHAVAWNQEGRPLGASRVVATAEATLGLVTLKATADDAGAVLAYGAQTQAHATVLRATLLDREGQAKSAPLELVTTSAQLLWLEVLDTSSGPVVLYATSRGELAEVRAVGLSRDGKLRFADREVASNLRAWQAVRYGQGLALAGVVARDDKRGGTVRLWILDPEARVAQPPVELLGEAPAELDLDLGYVGSNFVVAWSERSRIDSRVVLAAVDVKGQIVSRPAPATARLGEQTLVKLISGGPFGRAALLWEDLNLPGKGRQLSLAEVDEHGRLRSTIARIPSSAQSSHIPEVVAAKHGWSVLTLDDTLGESNGVDGPMPAYLELDGKLQPIAKVPLKFPELKEQVPLMAWGLDCRATCRATVAFDGSPVNISLAELATRSSGGDNSRSSSVPIAQAQSLPRLEQLETLVEVEPLSDIAVVRDKDQLRLGYVTYFDPATPLDRLEKPGPDGRTDPLQARVDVLTLTENAEPTLSSTISYRAASQPGLSLAPSLIESRPPGVKPTEPKSADSSNVLLAWSAIDQNDPQVFLTVVGVDGKKRAQRMLTRRKGGLDEVSVVPATEGWFAAWVDERQGVPEAYVTRVNRVLERRGQEQRISVGKGQVTGIALLPQEGHLLYVWSEVHAEPSHRRVELYSRRLSLIDGVPLAPPSRLLEIGGAVKFLTIARFGTGAVLSWLEVMQEGTSVDAPGRVRMLRLDEKGAAPVAPLGLGALAGEPMSVTIDCPTELCHGVLTLESLGRGELGIFTFDPTKESAPQVLPVYRSLGTVEQNVAPVLVGSHLFAVDQVDAERTRIIHATLRWE